MCFPKTPYFTNIIPPLKTKPEHGPLFTSHVAFFSKFMSKRAETLLYVSTFSYNYLDLYLCVTNISIFGQQRKSCNSMSPYQRSLIKRSTTDKWYDPCNTPSKSQSVSNKDVKTLQILTCCAWAIWSEEGLRHEWGDSWEKEESVSLGAWWTVSRLGQRLIKL